MIERVEYCGALAKECSLDGERLSDDAYPGHPNGIPLSRDRWLILYATRGWRSVDDDRSIVYQLQEEAPDGKLLKEGFLARATNDWDLYGDGRLYVRQHGHPVAFWFAANGYGYAYYHYKPLASHYGMAYLGGECEANGTTEENYADDSTWFRPPARRGSIPNPVSTPCLQTGSPMWPGTEAGPMRSWMTFGSTRM